MKYFLHLAYKGTQYRGWQRQLNISSIQETLEQTIGKMLKQKIVCVGCGRTDAGVHASQFFCHIVVKRAIDFDPVFRLNKMLPNDIAIFDFIPTDARAHAQYDAIARTYEYYFHCKKNPFLSEVSAYYTEENLDFEKMKTACLLLKQYKDYRTFCKQPHLYKHTRCEVSEVSLNCDKKRKQHFFRFTSNRFLRNMIRLLVGNLLEVGYGKINIETFEQYLKNEKKPPHYNMAYPQGLYLSQVVYPFLKIPTLDFDGQRH